MPIDLCMVYVVLIQVVSTLCIDAAVTVCHRHSSVPFTRGRNASWSLNVAWLGFWVRSSVRIIAWFDASVQGLTVGIDV